MLEQSIIAALIVVACSAYAAWTLMPAAGRRAVARVLLRLPLPARAAARLERHLAAQGGCGCDGCDVGAKKPEASSTQPIRIHRRAKP